MTNTVPGCGYVGADGRQYNMYGFTPCPRCLSPYRCEFNNKPGVVQCDDCGHQEPKSELNSDTSEE